MDLRIADTFFTYLTLHGKGELKDVSYETLYYKHVDPHDLLTIIIHFGNVKEEEKLCITKELKKMQGTQ